MPEPEEDSEERPSLRKVQNYIPGFRGYSKMDDVREADRMLRMIISQKILLTKNNLEKAQEILEEAMIFEENEMINSLLNSLKRISSEIGYADSGFSWMASDTEILGEEAERLYEYDGQLLDQLATVLRVSEELKMGAKSADKSVIKRFLSDIRARLSMIEDIYRKKMLVMSQ